MSFYQEKTPEEIKAIIDGFKRNCKEMFGEMPGEWLIEREVRQALDKKLKQFAEDTFNDLTPANLRAVLEQVSDWRAMPIPQDAEVAHPGGHMGAPDFRDEQIDAATQFVEDLQKAHEEGQGKVIHAMGPQVQVEELKAKAEAPRKRGRPKKIN